MMTNEKAEREGNKGSPFPYLKMNLGNVKNKGIVKVSSSQSLSIINSFVILVSLENFQFTPLLFFFKVNF